MPGEQGRRWAGVCPQRAWVSLGIHFWCYLCHSRVLCISSEGLGEDILLLFASFPPSSYARGKACAMILAAICIIPALSAYLEGVLGIILLLFVSFPPSLHVWGKARAKISSLFVSFPPSSHSLGGSWGADFVAICIIPALFVFLQQG